MSQAGKISGLPHLGFLHKGVLVGRAWLCNKTRKPDPAGLYYNHKFAKNAQTITKSPTLPGPIDYMGGLIPVYLTCGSL